MKNEELISAVQQLLDDTNSQILALQLQADAYRKVLGFMPQPKTTIEITATTNAEQVVNNIIFGSENGEVSALEKPKPKRTKVLGKPVMKYNEMSDTFWCQPTFVEKYLKDFGFVTFHESTTSPGHMFMITHKDEIPGSLEVKEHVAGSRYISCRRLPKKLRDIFVNNSETGYYSLSATSAMSRTTYLLIPFEK